MTISRHHAGCTCAARVLSRRNVLGFAAAGIGTALIPSTARAAYGESEFMLLSCMDPRLVHDVHEYMEAKKLRGEYSQVALAGGPAAAVAPSFKKWHPAIWENLGATIQLHKIKRVFGMTHRDCGAVKIAYGEAMVANPEVELKTHKAILTAFAAEVKKRHPTLGCETGIMALNGSVEMIG